MPPDWVVLACENEVAGRPCARWAVMQAGAELPYCRGCRLPGRSWRLVTAAEIEDADRLLVQRLTALAAAVRRVKG